MTAESSIIAPDQMQSLDQASYLSVLALIRTAYTSERSLMAWIRTSVSLYTFGFSISTFIDYLIRQGGGIQVSPGLRRLGIVLIAMGIVALAFAMIEHSRRIRRMRRLGLPSTSRWSLPLAAATALQLIGLVTLIALAGA